MEIESLSLFLNCVQTSLVCVQTIFIVISFVVVLRQLRQFNENLRYESYARVNDDNARIAEILIDKPHMNEVYYASNPDFIKLDKTRQDFYNYIALLLGMLERVYLLFKKGWVDSKTWESWERWLVDGWIQFDVFEVFWKNERTFYHEDFYKHIDRKLADFKAYKQKSRAKDNVTENTT